MPLRTYVLIVGECKPRKNPELISQVIIDNPQIEFVIHGNGWEKYLLLPHRNLQNLVIIPFSLKKNPELLREATLLLSLSKLEGGPIPVLEALASGTPVLATDTGFSRDVINETNGRVLPVDADVNLISEHLNSLLNLKSKLWNRDLLDGNYTWANLGKAIYE
jgi:glycosyltransferase involved in cell wall biosynthesis